ncbi:MAG: PspA/IM30 family protein [Candidatus Poribacteria bacterium]|nr:PspA/IM30 family protein [Candidatus Poribacteria bacterium]
MKSIKIAGKKFKLASRMARLYALFIDFTCLSVAQIILVCLMRLIAELISPTMWSQPQGPLQGFVAGTFVFFNITLWTFGLLFIDGFRKGQGIGKKLLSLQVLRLKDGKPCSFKDAFIRRLAGIFQPLDFLWTLGEKRQRMGDKFAETVVVRYEPEQTEVETEDPEKVLENAIVEMKDRLSEARGKVDASIGIEKQFQDAYEGAIAQEERWQERALIALKAGREDLAREDIEKRNEYRRLADKHKKQWEEQKQIVRELSNLLEHFQQKMMEAEGEKTSVIAKHRNVNAEAHLREMLKEIQDSKALETLVKMGQNATEAATLAKAAAEVDAAYQDTKLEREFAGYAEEASLDKDLAELKTKLQK